MRFGKGIILIVLSLVTILVGTELFFRFVRRIKPLTYTRSYDPIFVSGDWTGEESRDSLLHVATNRPEVNSYTSTSLGHFVWDGRFPPRSSTSLTDFLFSNHLSRYSSREVDLILCSKPSALSVFVLGGSTAVGTSASSKLTTWHAILERNLRHSLSRNDVYVFNGAMGGFLSIQERLAYHLAVSSRDAKVVIILNGANDLSVPASSGTRPGDPYQLGTRYNQMYNNPLILALAETSATFNHFLQADIRRSIAPLRDRLAQDDAAFKVYAESAVSIYMDNMVAVLRDCEAQGRACLVAVQPAKPVSEIELGASTDTPDVLPSHRYVQLYELLRKAIQASRYASHFIDLSHVVKSLDELAYYTDTAHFDDRGQMLIADALLPATLDMAKRKRDSRDSILACDRILPREIEQLQLSQLTRAHNGAVTETSNGILLTADPRQWAYSASLPLDQLGQYSEQKMSVKISLGSMDGEIGVILLQDIAARSALYVRQLTPDSADTEIYIPLPSGIDRVVLVFRKQTADGQPSHIEVRRISIVATD